MNSIKAKNINRDVLDKIISLLYNKYPKARNALIEFEALTSLKAYGAFTDIRDFVDHIHLAINPSLNSKEQNDQLVQAEEHLRRAIVEPYQEMVHYKMDVVRNLYNRYQYSFFRYVPLFGVSNIISISEIKKGMDEIGHLVEEGRKLKANNIWSDDFDTAIEKCFLPAQKRATDIEDKLFKACERINNLKGSCWISFIMGLAVMFVWTLFTYIIPLVKNLVR